MTLEIDPGTGMPLEETQPKKKSIAKTVRLAREMQRVEGGGMAFIPSSVMAKIRPALNWVGRRVEYKRRPTIRHKVWRKTEHDCIGVVIDVTIDRGGVNLLVNCTEHEEHKECWKRPHMTQLIAEDGTQVHIIKPTDSSLAFWNGGTGRI